MAGFTLPFTLPLTWQSARSAQFWAGQDRRIYARFYVSRPDGATWQDMTSYLVSARISLGNVADVGTGNSGVDTGVRQATFELINERRPEISWPEELARDETYIVGDEADIVGLSTDGGEVLINKLFGASAKPVPVGASFHPRDRNSPWNYWKGVYAPLLWPTREVILEVAAVPVGVTPGPADWVRVFHGFMGDSISASSDNGRITIECRDLMKRLQDTYIETVREYGSEAGTPAETVMQQIINDNITVNPPTLYVPVSPGFMVRPYKCEYSSVADALWQIANQFGGWLGYKWIPDYNDFRLTLLIPPRGKDAASADWTFDGRQIIVQHLDISDRDIRNAVLVTYRDINSGKRETTGAFDSASILEFGRRAMQIEEADTSLIDTLTEAMALADAVLHDLKDITATTRLILPFLPTLDVFDGILVTNPRLSSTQDFYGVESVEHVLDFDRGQFRTEVVASGRVVGAHTRWLLMETRPGSPGKPIDMPPPYTVIVAAADSPMEERKKAQYFCDGVDDQEQINAAIASLGATGGEVRLLKGTYYLSGNVLMRSYVSLVGHGTGTILRLMGNGLRAIQSVSGGVTRIAIRDLAIDGNKAAYISGRGIELADSSQITISGVTISQCDDSALYISQCTSVLVASSVLTDSDEGIYAYASTCNITGCVCQRNSTGILVQASNGVTVASSNVSLNGSSGIWLSSCSHCTVSGNVCTQNGMDGILVASSSNNNIVGNTCTENAQAYTNYSNITLGPSANQNTVQTNLCRAGSLAAKPLWGIKVVSGVANLVANNDCYQGGTSGGISDSGTSTNFGAGNRKGDGTWGTGPG